VVSGPQPQSLGAYLASKHPADILVTDRRGGTHWYHNPAVDGDTLRGVRSRELPQPRLAMAISDIDRVEEPHFSTGKTLGLIGAVLGAAAVGILILASNVSVSY
jgi:hypothetical protein